MRVTQTPARRGESVRRIAMWSGPRNISTAMMRAWENRPDTAVWDEPLYGYYLAATGSPHPGAAEVIAAWGHDWQPVVERILGPVPLGRAVFYQKHMTHHLLPEVDRAWLSEVCNCFLIRDPAEVIASYARTRDRVTAADIGIEQQAAIFNYVREHTGLTPPVLDASDVLADPRGMLHALCNGLDVEFSERMLCWPAGPRDTDGVWAKYWYDSVWASTGFKPYRATRVELPPALAALAAASRPLYQHLHALRLRP